MATREVLAGLAARYQSLTGCEVRLESAGGVDVARRVAAGEAADVVVLAAKAIDELIQGGRLLADSRTDIMRSGIAIAVRAGADLPDISTESAVKQAVLAAPSISYSTGPSGVYLVGLFERWGIFTQIQPRIVQAPPGVPVGTLVARGAGFSAAERTDAPARHFGGGADAARDSVDHHVFRCRSHQLGTGCRSTWPAGADGRAGGRRNHPAPGHGAGLS
jgi:hypothetical protein